MKPFTLPHFGEILNQGDFECYETSLEVDDRVIRLQLNFEALGINDTLIQKLKNAVNNLDKLRQDITNLLLRDYQNQGRTFRYIEELKIYNSNYQEAENLEIFEMIFLDRIAFYPNIMSSFIVFDYKLELERYILVIKLGQDQQLIEVTVES
jgi:hypothetical protein